MLRRRHAAGRESDAIEKQRPFDRQLLAHDFHDLHSRSNPPAYERCQIGGLAVDEIIRSHSLLDEGYGTDPTL